MKRLLSLLLVIAMLFGVCTIFTACDSTSVSDEDDDDDKKKEEKKDTFKGLKIGLPKSFKKDDVGDSYASYGNDDYTVYIHYEINYEEVDAKELQEDYEEDLEEGIEDGYLENGKAGKTDKKTYYIYAVSAEEPYATAIAFYTTDNSVWIVEISNTEENEDFDIDQMIKYITDWEYSDPEEEDEEEEENNNGNNENVVPAPGPAPAPTPGPDNGNAEQQDPVVNGEVVYDNMGIVIYFTDIITQYDDSSYELQIANNSGYNVEIYAEDVVINRTAYVEQGCSCYVEDGNYATMNLWFYDEEMARFGIERIGNIAFRVDVVNADDYQILSEDVEVTLATDFDGYENNVDTSGALLMDEEGIRVILMDIEMGNKYSSNMWLYIENNREEPIGFDLERPTVNHWLMPSVYGYASVLPGTYTVAPVDMSALLQLEIYNADDIHTLSFSTTFYAISDYSGTMICKKDLYYFPGYEDYVQDMPFEGTVLYDGYGFELRLVEIEESMGSVSVQLFMCNYLQDYSVEVYVEDVFINGFETSNGLVETLDIETRCLAELWLWTDSDIGFEGLEDLESLSFKLTVNDENDYPFIEETIEVPLN